MSHLPPIYTDSMKQSLLSSPASMGSSLFKEEDVQRLSALADKASMVKSNQSVIDYMSTKSRSPMRSPPRSSSGFRSRRRNSRSPQRSPKKVRFTASLAATSKSPLPKKTNLD